MRRLWWYCDRIETRPIDKEHYGSWVKTVVIIISCIKVQTCIRVGIVFTVKFQWLVFNFTDFSNVVHAKQLIIQLHFFWYRIIVELLNTFLKLQMCVLLRHNYNSPIAIIQCKHKRIMQFLFTDSLLIIVIW